ncbi:MAG: RNA polymerase sigma factor [Clostridiales bacterium]|nr:RNA polymerase sigma factor [Clostridiales bacterium]
MTDQELIELFLARSEEAVPALAAQYGPYCRTVAAQLLADPRDVDECLNDCWLAVWRAIPPARPERFKGWLAAIVRNRALAMGRENSRRPPTVGEAALELASCLPPGGDPMGEAEHHALADAIGRFLRAQPRDIRIVFVRRYWYADTVEDAARRLGWSVSKTKSVLFRTRNKLRDHLQKEGFL